MKNPSCSIDALVIGAGPVGLFTVFELGLHNIKAAVVDVLPFAGGQCAELYPEKPIYDIPAIPKISGQELTDNLLAQIKPFAPTFFFNHQVLDCKQRPDGKFLVSTDQGQDFEATVVIIASGGGVFAPKKPHVAGLADLDSGAHPTVLYAVRDKTRLDHRAVVIAGGGDSAVDWALELVDRVDKLTLVHRRARFRAAPAQVDRLRELEQQNRLQILVGEIDVLHSKNQKLSAVSVGEYHIPADYLLVFYGLTMQAGALANFQLESENDRILVDTAKFESSRKQIFAVGDANTYPGKLKLILSGFHEAALAARACFDYVFPEKPYRFMYTTTSSELKKRLQSS